MSVTMRNTGTTTWTREAGYKLANEGPVDRFGFGFHRAELPPGVQVAPGQEYTFTFNLTAPDEPGFYFIRTRVLRENVEVFGAYSAIRTIVVR
jgi:hypothetical protein